MDLEARIDRLEDAVTRLAEAQARTEERVGRLEEAVIRLAEAQARTEARLEALTERVDRLAEAQARTEARLGELVQAQARTEARLGELAQAQARTEARLGELAQAQARTEARVETLAQAVLALTQQVGQLSETIGFTLEDLAREVAPAYLAQHHGIDVAGLDRRFLSVEGEEIEPDLYGEGRRDGEPVVVVGEVRSRIYGRDVESSVHRARRLAPQLPGRPVVVLFGFVIHPSAREAARQHGAIVISSSGR